MYIYMYIHTYIFIPYVVSIMPEPADYFMPCINTPDCRIRCLDVYNAFEEALQATVQEPAFVTRLDVNVESKYFSLDAALYQRHVGRVRSHRGGLPGLAAQAAERRAGRRAGAHA